MFEKGQLVVYGETGVCRVEDICMRELPAGEALCYQLQPMYHSFVIYTPVDDCRTPIRLVVSREEAEWIIEDMPTCKTEVCNLRSPRELTNYYSAVIKEQDCRRLMVLTRSIHEKKRLLSEQKRKLSAVDERFLKKAEDLLFGELAAALSMKKSETREYAAKILQSALAEA